MTLTNLQINDLVMDIQYVAMRLGSTALTVAAVVKLLDIPTNEVKASISIIGSALVAQQDTLS